MLLFAVLLFTSAHAHALEQVDVYREPGRFGGWPANHGMWSWGDELLVGFGAGYFEYLGPDRHAIARDRPEEHLLARSTNGGRSWSIENPGEEGVLIPQGPALHGVVPPHLEPEPLRDCPGGIDFTHPDFALTVRMWDIHKGASRFYYSTDRGRHWTGPFRLPLFGRGGIAARTDYVVNGPHDCLLFVTAAKENGTEGRPVCVRTTDGGKSWEPLGWIGPEPTGFAIMPATCRLDADSLVSAIRRREGPRRFIEAYRSDDLGRTWRQWSTPVPSTGIGNPAALNQLADGRLCLTYGYRGEPYSIRARLSADEGRTWSDDLILRSKGGCQDLGYPRTVQRPDGTIVTVYYFNDHPKGDRYIAATLWKPDEFGESGR